jgi:hypothetical protein
MTLYLTHYLLKRCLNDENTNDTRNRQDLGSCELFRDTTEGAP